MSATPVPKADKHVHGRLMWSKCRTSFVHNIPNLAKKSLVLKSIKIIVKKLIVNYI